jgi:hypothetical protein
MSGESCSPATMPSLGGLSPDTRPFSASYSSAASIFSPSVVCEKEWNLSRFGTRSWAPGEVKGGGEGALAEGGGEALMGLEAGDRTAGVWVRILSSSIRNSSSMSISGARCKSCPKVSNSSILSRLEIQESQGVHNHSLNSEPHPHHDIRREAISRFILEVSQDPDGSWKGQIVDSPRREPRLSLSLLVPPLQSRVVLVSNRGEGEHRR